MYNLVYINISLAIRCRKNKQPYLVNDSTGLLGCIVILFLQSVSREEMAQTLRIRSVLGKSWETGTRRCVRSTQKPSTAATELQIHY